MAITKPLILDETGQDMVDELTDIITAIDNISRFSGAYNDLTGKPTLGTAAAKNFTTSVTSGSSDLVTSGAVHTAIDNLPNPMLFKGTLGTNGTITSLPTAGSTNEGFTYKVITAATYSGTAAKVGDVFVSNGSAWILIPAGDDVEDTWRNIKVNGTEKLGTAISSGSVDFVNGTNTTVAFDATGSKMSVNASDEKVAQNNVTTDDDYRLLFSGSANNTSKTEGTRKYSTATYNPYRKALTIGDRVVNSTVGNYSSAIGHDLKAIGIYSHAEGNYNIASGGCSHAEGDSTTASESCAHAEGYGTTASGSYSHAEGSNSTASNAYAHAEGSGTIASHYAAHAEGTSTTASGYCSHTEGSGTTANGYYSHAEGFNTQTPGAKAHAEGDNTKASAPSSHAEGYYTEAKGDHSHAEGYYTEAKGPYQHVAGKYNVASLYPLEIIGNGTADDARSNARTLDWDGNEMLAGSLSLAGASSDITLSGTGNTWDGTNTSLKSAIQHTLDTKVYGIHISGSESDPNAKVTYLADAVGMTPAHMNFTTGEFDYGSWGDTFIIKGIRPCILQPYSDTSTGGTRLIGYLNPNNYDQTLDGDSITWGAIDNMYPGYSVMIEFPKIWYKVVPDASGDGASIYISNHKVDAGYKDYAYIDYQGKHKEHFYMSAYNGCLNDGKLRSNSGEAVMKNYTAAQEIAYAQANNAPGWYIEDAGEIMLINFLLFLIGKSTDTQAVFGQGLTSGGTEAINANFRTGIHNAKGLFYGTNSGTIADGSYGNAVKVFGIENYWGFQWRRYAGDILLNGTRLSKLCWGTEDGSTTNSFNLTGDGYVNIGATPSGTSGSYINTMKFTSNGMYSSVSSGTSTTHYCDGQWFNNSITAVALRGGSSYSGALVGASYVSLYLGAGDHGWAVGAAPSFK